MEERRRKPLYLGPATWGGHEGVLLLAPPYPLGGLESNHLIFSWDLLARKLSRSTAGSRSPRFRPSSEAVVESIPPTR